MDKYDYSSLFGLKQAMYFANTKTLSFMISFVLTGQDHFKIDITQ